MKFIFRHWTRRFQNENIFFRGIILYDLPENSIRSGTHGWYRVFAVCRTTETHQFISQNVCSIHVCVILILDLKRINREIVLLYRTQNEKVETIAARHWNSCFGDKENSVITSKNNSVFQASTVRSERFAAHVRLYTSCPHQWQWREKCVCVYRLWFFFI